MFDALKGPAVICLLAGLTVAAGTATAQGAEAWQRHEDPFFHLSIDYPAGWRVRSDLRSGELGGVLTFEPAIAEIETTKVNRHTGAETGRIVVGLSLTGIGPDESLEEWDRRRQQALLSLSAENEILSAEERLVGGLNARRTELRNPLGSSRTTEIRRGEVVWFVWDSGSEELSETHDHMVDSLSFGGHAPQSLRQTYGAAGLDDPPEPGAAAVPTKGLSSWQLPLRGSMDAHCSDTHGNPQTHYALDVFVPSNTVLYAAKSGFVTYRDWYNNYGKLLKLQTGIYEHFYSHLNAYFVNLYQAVSTAQAVGRTGATGAVTPHLHFEVRDRNTNTGVDLTPMPGFTPSLEYPEENGEQLVSCGSWHHPW